VSYKYLIMATHPLDRPVVLRISYLLCRLAKLKTEITRITGKKGGGGLPRKGVENQKT